MLSHEALLLALRAPLLTLTVVTTGSVTLAATTTGYSRAVGDFTTDGLAVGMEITPSGFASNPVDVITAVDALTLTTVSPRTGESAGAGRTIQVTLPVNRGWENIAFNPPAGRPYLEESLAPGTKALLTLATSGTLEDTGLYVIRLYGLSDRGSLALSALADAVLGCYKPGQSFTLSTGDVVQVRTDTAPVRSAALPDDPGWVVSTVSVPYRIRTTNT